MQAFHTNRSSSGPGRRGLVVALLAVALLGSVGFAAAGGVQMVKGWFMSVTVEVDGQVVATEDVVLDENGTATIPLPPDAVEGAEELTLSVEGTGTDVPPEGGVATINMTVEDGAAQLQVEVEPVAEEAEE
jgi:hypothetical protein